MRATLALAVLALLSTTPFQAAHAQQAGQSINPAAMQAPQAVNPSAYPMLPATQAPASAYPVTQPPAQYPAAYQQYLSLIHI